MQDGDDQHAVVGGIRLGKLERVTEAERHVLGEIPRGGPVEEEVDTDDLADEPCVVVEDAAVPDVEQLSVSL